MPTRKIRQQGIQPAGSDRRNQIPNKISVPGLKTQCYPISSLFISLIHTLLQQPIVHSPFILSGPFLEPAIRLFLLTAPGAPSARVLSRLPSTLTLLSSARCALPENALVYNGLKLSLVAGRTSSRSLPTLRQISIPRPRVQAMSSSEDDTPLIKTNGRAASESPASPSRVVLENKYSPAGNFTDSGKSLCACLVY